MTRWFWRFASLLAIGCAICLGACNDLDRSSQPAPDATLPVTGPSGLAALATANVAADDESAGAQSLGLSAKQGIAACQRACTVQAACSLDEESACNAQCEIAEPVLQAHDCSEQAAAENDCLSSLECRELRQYSNDGRRLNEKCGDRARAFFADCTLGAGTVPQACTDMCAQFLACNALAVSPGSCEETCVASATGFDWNRGEACGTAFLDFAACVADAPCSDVGILVALRFAPPSCFVEQALFDERCR